MTPGLEDALTALLQGEWILTTRDTADGDQVLVAHRPIGWDGPGDPAEELVAPTHTQMRALLSRRYHTGDAVIDPDEQQDDDTTPGGGMEREYPTLGGASGTHPDDR